MADVDFGGFGFDFEVAGDAGWVLDFVGSADMVVSEPPEGTPEVREGDESDSDGL